MNKISLYTLLILIFLGLSKSFSPSEQKTEHIVNDRVLSFFFSGSPLSIILKDTFQAGFLIKTYYLKLKVVHGFKAPEEIVVRTTEEYWDNLQDKIGMSIFRRKEIDNVESTIPLPPGSLYLGDPSYGRWVYENSGQRIWRFHRPYRKKFPTIFGWGDWRPTYEFYKRIQVSETSNTEFKGLHKEFGTDGSITKKNYSAVEDQTRRTRLKFRKTMASFFWIPPWNKKK